MCNHDCYNCPHEDCINDELTFSDYVSSSRRDREVLTEEKITDDRRIKWQIQNAEKHRESCRRYAAANKDKREQYRKENYDHLQGKAKEYNAAHRDEINARSRERKRARWQANPEYYRQKQREYRARRKELTANGI